jgi:hypothetical protein
MAQSSQGNMKNTAGSGRSMSSTVITASGDRKGSIRVQLFVRWLVSVKGREHELKAQDRSGAFPGFRDKG